MVKNGHARDWLPYSYGVYQPYELAARGEGLGIWSGTFDNPWDWRGERQ